MVRPINAAHAQKSLPRVGRCGCARRSSLDSISARSAFVQSLRAPLKRANPARRVIDLK